MSETPDPCTGLPLCGGLGQVMVILIRGSVFSLDVKVESHVLKLSLRDVKLTFSKPSELVSSIGPSLDWVVWDPFGFHMLSTLDAHLVITWKDACHEASLLDNPKSKVRAAPAILSRHLAKGD